MCSSIQLTSLSRCSTCTAPHAANRCGWYILRYCDSIEYDRIAQNVDLEGKVPEVDSGSLFCAHRFCTCVHSHVYERNKNEVGDAN